MNLNAIKKILIDNAPAIFTGLALAGTIETVVLTVRAVPRIEDRMWELEQEKAGTPERKEIIQECWTEVVPPCAALFFTMFCIVAANQAHVRKEAGIAALYSFYEGKYKDYKLKTRELHGREVDEEIEREIIRDKLKREELYPRRSEEYLVYDPITDQYFYSTFKEKEHAQEQLNRILGMESAVAYNYFLSLFRNADHKFPIGNIFGWFMDDTFTEYYYWNQSFYGRPYAEVIFEQSDEVTDQQEEIYILRCTLEPIAENNMDDSEAKDSQDKQAL